MSQRVLRMEVEMLGNKLLIVNDQPIETGDIELDEKIIGGVSLEQQWFLICLLKKNINKLYHEYRRSRVRQGEVSEARLRELETAAARSRKHKPRLL